MMLQYAELSADLQRIRRFLTTGSEGEQTSDQRRFAYIACISALYSSFENFSERVIFRFTQMLLAKPAGATPDQMDKLRRRYVRNASTLLTQGLGTGRYHEVTELDVAKSLASCLDETTSSLDLRLEVISLHSSNLRWEALSELVNWAAPDMLANIHRSDSIRKWMSQTVDVTENTLAETLRNELEDLVERRNEVAHRAIPDEILSYDRLIAKVDYINAVALALVANLGSRLLEAAVNVGAGVPIGVPAEHFRKNRVVIFSSLAAAVSEGDYILASTANSMRWGRVLEIKVADERVGRTDAGIEAGLLLDFAVRRQATLYLMADPPSELFFLPDGIFGDCGPFDSA